MQHLRNIYDKEKPSNPPITEFLSRPARKKIVESLCEALLERQRELGVMGGSMGHNAVSGACALAGLLGVSRKSVSRWLRGDMQSCNANAGRLLVVALEVAPEALEEILLWDLERHRSGVEVFLNGHGGGT